MCFQIEGENSHAVHCSKSRALTKVVDLILDIHSSDHQCVIIKGFLQSKRLKRHMVDIGVDQSLKNSAMYKYRCL